MFEGLSIIIPAFHEGNSLEQMVPNIEKTIDLSNHEIIIVNNGGTATNSLKKFSTVRIYGMASEVAAKARNFGASMASNDFLIFLDAHMKFFKKGWGQDMLSALKDNSDSVLTPSIGMIENEQIKGCGFRWSDIGMTTKWLPCKKDYIHEIPFASSFCMALRKAVLEEIGGFDSGMSMVWRFWGVEDSEISLRAWLMGYRVLCDPRTTVGHSFRESFPFPITSTDIYFNKIRLAFSHFSPHRLANYLKAYSLTFDDLTHFNRALFSVLENDVMDRREQTFSRRKHSDDWFFEKFPMNWVEQRAEI